ncbi:DNA-3-methyladenine glycosylase family protein [Bacillus pinisoli]|uniref:DNA-3-methyladenine glycosylase family protein n=1 Tax=Bacillus pinisoli TaxID=2901866 RepID=UPI001FF12C2C|nr:DNA-3-methyladenine glycosylase [Bacillus pinisoli]
MWHEYIEIKGPYCFEAVLERLSMDPLNHINQQEKIITIPIYINDAKEVVTIQGTGTINNPSFHVSGGENKGEVLKEVRRIFQWDVPLEQVYQHFAKTNLHDLAKLHIGTPLVLDMNPYLSLIKCIIHQQINMKFAFTLTERFVKTFGEKKDGIWFYPRPEKVASLSISDLRSLQFSQRKAEYILNISTLLANNDLSIQELARMNSEEVIQTLIKIRGVGRWTIENLLLFGFGRPNLFPKADIGIQNAIKLYFGLEEKPDIEVMNDLSKEWEPYLSYASLYLWRSLEKKVNGAINSET